MIAALVNEYGDMPEMVVVYRDRSELEEKIRGYFKGVTVEFNGDTFLYADGEHPNETINWSLTQLEEI